MAGLSGINLDDWLGYTTKKVVYIRDQKLGLIYYSLVVCVLLYIFGVQILLHNEHFMLRNVQGMGRMAVSHPTLDLCEPTLASCKSDYRSFRELSYCNEYVGDSPEKIRAPCKFEDVTSILPQGEVDNKMFIPTAVEIVTEKRKCKPGPDNGFSCENEYEEIPGSDCLHGTYMCTTRGGLKDQAYFVADTKNFVIQFTSSYDQGEVHGTSLDHPAYYEVCPARVREANKTHYWRDRMQHSADSEIECDKDHVKVLPVPCLKGVNCSRRRQFDIMEDSGLNKAIKSGKIRPPERHGPVGLLARKATPANVSSPIVQDVGQGFPRAKSPKLRKRASGHLTADINEAKTGAALPGSSRQTMFAQNRSGASQQEPKSVEQGQWTSKYGDVFKLSRLMELAGADLDKSFNFEGWSARLSGTVLEVSTVYSNLHPFYSSFGYKDVQYHYRVKELPLPYVSRKQLAAVQPPDYPETRRYEIRHGILIWFRVDGQFGTFNTTYLLIYMVTASALIGAATVITDLIAIYVHNRKTNYFHLKYETTALFGNKWQCSKCDYWNSQTHSTCQGLPKWENREEAPLCGAPFDSSSVPAAELSQ